MTQPDYFDSLYYNNSDPWHYQTRWYEKRKRAITLAVLPKDHYGSAIELGCSNGVFSQEVAPRCDSLLCLDGNAQAVALAQQRLGDLPHVSVRQATLPKALPPQQFDLIIIGEILYYLTVSETQAVLDWVKKSLNLNGTLVCCHWRYAIDGFEQNGGTVHALLQQVFNQENSGFFEQVNLNDADFVLGVWQKNDPDIGQQSVAQQEGLV